MSIPLPLSDDAHATHFLLQQLHNTGESQYVGTARAIKIPASSPVTYDVSRISIIKEARERGAGAVLLRFVEQWVWDNGGGRITGEAQIGFEHFYSK